MEEEKYEATINMWLKEIERMDELLKLTSEIVLSLRNKESIRANPTLILQAVDALKEVYRIIKPVVHNPQIRDEFDKKIEELRKKADKKVKILTMLREEGYIEKVECPNELYYDIDKVYDEILRLRQELNLGIPTERKFNIEHWLKKANR
jgi:hypothetical protein